MAFEELVDTLHTVDGLIEMEVEFGDNAQLVSLQVAHLTANLTCVFLNLRHSGGFLVLREDTEIDMGNAQIGRDTHFADRDKRAAQRVGIAEEDVAQVLLYETFNLF